MKGQIARWGNSAAVRLPKTIMEDLKVSPGTEVEMWVEGRELRMRAAPTSKTYRLDELLAQIRPDAIPAMEDWPAVGAEVIDDDYSR